MAGHSRPKDGVASARLCPAIHALDRSIKKDVDARDKPRHDEGRGAAVLEDHPRCFSYALRWVYAVRSFGTGILAASARITRSPTT
jgi:hypothetical protein